MMPMLITVPVFRFFVLFLLLLGAQRLCLHTSGYLRLLIAAFFGSAYAALCLLPGFAVMGKLHYVMLLFIGFISFGIAVKPFAVFICLSILLEGLTQQNQSIGSVCLFFAGSAGLVFILMRNGRNTLLPVTITHKNKTISFYALYDTGNQLKDPSSGQSVMVVSPVVAKELMGLTPDQIRDPVETIGQVSGLRLIPYRSVGCQSGFLLGMLIKEVKIGRKKFKRVVAFAPEPLDDHGKYEALAGGVL